MIEARLIYHLQLARYVYSFGPGDEKYGEVIINQIRVKCFYMLSNTAKIIYGKDNGIH